MENNAASYQGKLDRICKLLFLYCLALCRAQAPTHLLCAGRPVHLYTPVAALRYSTIIFKFMGDGHSLHAASSEFHHL